MIHDLKTLILSFHPVIAIETVEEERVARIITQIGEELHTPVFEWSMTRGLTKRPKTQAIHGTAEPLGLVKHLAALTVPAVFHLKDFASHLSNAAVARKFREVAQQFAKNQSSMILTGKSISFPADIKHQTVHFEMHLPTREELRDTIQPVMRSLSRTKGVQLQIGPDDLDAMLDALAGMTLNQARQTIAYAALIDGKVSPDDVQHIIDRKAQVIRDGGLLEFFPVDDNRYELGGFDRLKQWLERARLGFSEEARALNLQPPKGILIVGVQGCGKSLAAKVIAREWKLPLLKLDAGRLFDKYIGESEKNFRKAISLAESMSPAVLWIDEIEKAMPSSGSGSQDGGLSRRLFAGFLTWLQEKTEPVFVVATANDLTNTPPELLRKGRFDEIFFVDLPDAEDRTRIFGIHLGLRKQSAEDFNVEHLVAVTDGFSGAEIEQAVIGALYRALHARRSLDTELVLQEIQSTVPLSVSRREDINRIRETAQGRFVPVK